MKSATFMKTTSLQKFGIFLFAIILVLSIYEEVPAQEVIDEGVVTFGYRNNGKVREGASLEMFYKDGIVSYKSGWRRRAGSKEKQFLDYNESKTYQVLTTSEDKYVVKKAFSEYKQPKFKDKSETILGYECKKAVFKIKSNTIEVWYTEGLPIKGTPTISVGADLGLILKMVRNGSFEIFATNIEFRKVKAEELNFDIATAKEVKADSYLRKVIDSRYQTIKVFEREQINFGDKIENPKEDLLNITYRYSKGSVILKKIKLPELPKGTTVIADLTSWSNGDAYDRTGSLFIIPVKEEVNFLNAFKDGIENVPVYTDKNGKEFQGVVATENYEPPLELARFFTPFGVKQFNEYTQIEGYNWADSALYRQEITSLLPQNGEEIWIGVFIGNYDKGGHVASLNLKIHPSYSKDENKSRHWIKPIFNTLNIMEMSGQNYATMFHNDSLTLTIDIPEGLETLSLRYTSTGHGGWGGGDEFNPKLNEIIIDDEVVYKFVPWREDCPTYRLLNPSSGNFGNGLTSSDLSRSNWCPGSITVPEIIPLNNLTPGIHTLKIAIPIGERAGGSFSAWNVSGVLIGTYK